MLNIWNDQVKRNILWEDEKKEEEEIKNPVIFMSL